MDKREEKVRDYLKNWDLQVSRIQWGKIVIEIQNGMPVRIVEEKSVKLDV